VTAAQTLLRARDLGEGYQLAINAFIDAFRRASQEERLTLVASPIESGGWLEALIAATVSCLCHETGVPLPSWLAAVTCPTLFFALPARSFAMRIRLMLESPPPFRNRNVFVPANSLSRA